MIFELILMVRINATNKVVSEQKMAVNDSGNGDSICRTLPIECKYKGYGEVIAIDLFIDIAGIRAS